MSLVDERSQPRVATPKSRRMTLEQAGESLRAVAQGASFQSARLRAIAGAIVPQGVARRRLWLALRIIISLTLLVLVLWKAHITKFIHVLGSIDPQVWALGLAVGVLTNFISALLWLILLRSEGITLRYRSVIALYFMGHTFSQLLPSSIGGDVGKAIYVGKLTRQGVGAASATLMARVIGLLGLLLTAIPTAVAAALLFPRLGWAFALILIGVGAIYCVALTVLLRSPGLLLRVAGKRLAAVAFVRKLMELAETISCYRNRPRAFWAATLVGLAFYATSNLNFYIYGQALHVQAPFWFYWIAIPLSSLATTLPISLNGYGVRGATLVVLFGFMEVTAAASLSLSLLMELQLLIFALVGVGTLFHYNRLLARPATAIQGAPLPLPVTETHGGAIRRSNIMGYAPEAVTIVPVLTQAPADAAQEDRQYAAASQAAEATAPIRPLRLPALPRMRPTTMWAVAAGLLLVVVVAPLAIGRIFQSPPKVQLYTVTPQPLTSFVAGGGLTYPIASVQMTYPVSAQVLKVNVQVGQPVQSGEALLVLDGASTAAQLDQAYSQWQLAQAYVYQLESVNASSTQIAAAQEQAALSKSRYDGLNAQLRSSTFNNGIVSAPFAGIVTDVRVSPGSLLHSGQSLLTLQNLDSIIVRAEFPIDQVSQVHPGAYVEVDPAAAGSTSYSGTVTSINPALANQGSETFEAFITVPNPQHELFTGQSVYTRVSTTQVMLTVPEVAVINPQTDAIVYVVNNGVAHLRHVVVGPRDLDRFGILNGLQAGDQVIVAGQYQLTDNEKVTVQR